MMIWVNEAFSTPTLPKEAARLFLKTLSPYAPHLAEELWEQIGEKGLISIAPWPQYDPVLCTDEEIMIVIQINGKRRDEVKVAKNASAKDIEVAALKTAGAIRFMEGKPAKKVIVVPGRLVNIVV